MDSQKIIWLKKILIVFAGILAAGLSIAGFFLGDYLINLLPIKDRIIVPYAINSITLGVGIFVLFQIPILWLIHRFVIKPMYGEHLEEILVVMFLIIGIFIARYYPDILTSIGIVGVFAVGGYSIFFLDPRFRPLSEVEKTDPLEREILLQMSYEDAFLLGERAILNFNTIFHFWKISTSDKTTGTIIGHESFLASPSWEVMLRIQRKSENTTSVIIRCNPIPPISYPLLIRRRQIQGLNTISRYLKNEGIR